MQVSTRHKTNGESWVKVQSHQLRDLDGYGLGGHTSDFSQQGLRVEEQPFRLENIYENLWHFQCLKTQC